MGSRSWNVKLYRTGHAIRFRCIYRFSQTTMHCIANAVIYIIGTVNDILAHQALTEAKKEEDKPNYNQPHMIQIFGIPKHLQKDCFFLEKTSGYYLIYLLKAHKIAKRSQYFPDS